MSYEIGQRVKVIADIYEPPDDHSPGGYCARKGDIVVARSIRPNGEWPVSVSHEDRTDGNTFSIGLNEIEEMNS